MSVFSSQLNSIRKQNRELVGRLAFIEVNLWNDDGGSDIENYQFVAMTNNPIGKTITINLFKLPIHNYLGSLEVLNTQTRRTIRGGEFGYTNDIRQAQIVNPLSDLVNQHDGSTFYRKLLEIIVGLTPQKVRFTMDNEIARLDYVINNHNIEKGGHVTFQYDSFNS
jgi:hypothetical protein